MSDIAYQNKDIASKVTGESLIGQSLAPFGLPHLKIVSLLPTNLPAIESNELRLDNLFLLSDGSIAIIDYESKYERENFIKYLNYIARIVKRYALQNRFDELHEIRMIVIYTADVEHAEETFDLGGLVMTIESAYLVNLNSNHLYQKIRYKIEHKEALNEEEMTELMILPLTAKGEKPKQDYIEKAVQLAKQLPSRSDTLKVLSGILTFTDKIIDKEYATRLKEEFFMLTQVEQLLYEDCMVRAKKVAYEEARLQVIDELKEELTEELTEKITAEVTEGITEKATHNAIASFARACHSLKLPKEQCLELLRLGYALSESEAASYMQALWA